MVDEKNTGARCNDHSPLKNLQIWSACDIVKNLQNLSVIIILSRTCKFNLFVILSRLFDHVIFDCLITFFIFDHSLLKNQILFCSGHCQGYLIIWSFSSQEPRDDICQRSYQTRIFRAKILHKNAKIGMMANLQQNSAYEPNANNYTQIYTVCVKFSHSLWISVIWIWNKTFG